MSEVDKYTWNPLDTQMWIPEGRDEFLVQTEESAAGYLLAYASSLYWGSLKEIGQEGLTEIVHRLQAGEWLDSKLMVKTSLPTMIRVKPIRTVEGQRQGLYEILPTESVEGFRVEQGTKAFPLDGFRALFQLGSGGRELLLELAPE